MNNDKNQQLFENIAKLSNPFLSPLDLLPHNDFREKCIDLVLNGIPDNIDQITAGHFHKLRQHFSHSRVDNIRVVVFGGGTGLSNIIGGDSRSPTWYLEPFGGLKELFPKTRSVVCVTDDGGSTGELIKDLPLIALGDIRHVLLSSIQLHLLQKNYNLTLSEAGQVTAVLASIFNYRFKKAQITEERVNSLCLDQEDILPEELRDYLLRLVAVLYSDVRLAKTISRQHCLGNLLIVAAIYKNIPCKISNKKLEEDRKTFGDALIVGINEISERLGAVERSVLPCTTTPAQLRICYTNGVHVTGENKSSEALRGFPVDRVMVDFSDKVEIPKQICNDIRAADIIIMAPGSLYTSIIPIFQVPGIAESVRNNTNAQKILISNLWVQAGETDIAVSDPERKFHVSDMIRAYEHNIPGGTKELFHEVLCLSLKDVPASILQNYALEGKIPIYLDKNIVYEQGYIPVECGIFSKKALAERGVIQHDPHILAQAVKTVYEASNLISEWPGKNLAARRKPVLQAALSSVSFSRKRTIYPSRKFRLLESFAADLPIECDAPNLAIQHISGIREHIVEIIWKHQDISLDHLRFLKGVICIDKDKWFREQIWDKVYSFYDPKDSYIKIRADQLFDPQKIEVAFLIALGQSLLGNYAEQKRVEDVAVDGQTVGKIYHLRVRNSDEIISFFRDEQLDNYLQLSRMNRSAEENNHYTRLISSNEGFTPPGVLMGLTYAWYLDNRLATHIEYKMSLMKIRSTDLIPEQLKMLKRRHAIVDFFREVVFS